MHWIDVHHHIFPPEFVARHRGDVVQMAAGDGSFVNWTPAWSLEAMDADGIKAAILSLSVPGSSDVGLVRACNDYALDLARQHRPRFGVFAWLPLPEVDASLAEFERSLHSEHMFGVGLLSNYKGISLGDSRFEPLFEALNRAKTTAYVHPMVPPSCIGALPGVPDPMLEFPFDTTRAIVSLLTSGALDRYSDIRFIFSHAGGTLPILANRIAQVASIHPSLGLTRDQVFESIRRLYFDTASVANPAGWAATLETVAAERILYGTDFPYVGVQPQQQRLEGLAATAGLLDGVAHRNALDLFPALSESMV